MKTVIDQIKQAREIMTECNKRAELIELKIKNTKPSKNTAKWCEQMRKRSQLEREAEQLRNRASKVWNYATSFQGTVINWRDIFEVNGKTYHGIIELLDATF